MLRPLAPVITRRVRKDGAVLVEGAHRDRQPALLEGLEPLSRVLNTAGDIIMIIIIAGDM